MHADWSVECGVDDAVVVVPWNDANGTAAFIDLRIDPGATDLIREADAHPPLMQALRALNASRSPVFTAKCDVWPLAADELAQLRLDLGFDWNEEGTDDDSAESKADALRYGFASYIDLVCRDRALFASFPRHEHVLRRITRLVIRLDHPLAAVECVLRPAFVSLEAPQQGYAVSTYVKALGESERNARGRWSAALNDVVALLRRQDVVR